MDRESTRRLSVDDAKKNLMRRSNPVAGAGTRTAGATLASTRRRPWRAAALALAATRRRPWRAAGTALALGIAIGVSRTARRTLFAGIRRAIARGG